MRITLRVALLVSIYYGAFNLVYSQTLPIKGVIVDSVSRMSLANASVKVYNAVDKQLALFSSDSAGIFSGKVSNTATYLVAEHIGYYSKIFLLSSSNNIFIVKAIALTKSVKNLQEIEVKTTKAKVQFKPDRQVYTASQFGAAVSGTAVDILKNLPSISTNALGEILYRGSNNFLVLVNGKPVQGDAATILAQLPAGSIENVEVLNNPSAVFDADGKSGAVNIITKSNVHEGFIFQANTMAGTPPFKDYNNGRNPSRYNIDFFAGYKKNKVDITVGASYLRNDIAGNRDGDVFTIIGNTKTNFPSFGERSFKRYNATFRSTFNYAFHTTSNLSANFYIGKKFQSRVADLLYNNSKINLLNNTQQNFTYFNANDQQKTGVFTVGNVDYTKKFANKSAFTIAVLYEKANLTANTYNNNLRFPILTDTLQYTFNTSSNPLTAYRLKADYSFLVNAIQFQTGLQYRQDNQDGNFLYFATNNQNVLQLDPAFSSSIITKNYISAAYVQANGIHKNISYAAGLRLEHGIRDLLLPTLPVNSLVLTNLFPSFQFKYKFQPNLTGKIAYSKRIKRTNNFELNPIPEREHSETLEQGDAALLPEFVHVVDMGIEKAIKNGNYFITAYYQQTKNPIQRVNKVFNDTILNRIFTNAGVANQFGIEANITKQITKKWQTIFGGNMYHYSIIGSIFNNTVPFNNSSIIYSINTTQTFNLGNGITSQFSVNYLSERITAQGEDSRFLTPNLIIKKQSKDKRWTYQLSWLNMDMGLNESNRQRITTRGTNFYTTTNYIYETDQLQFNVSFNLTKKNRNVKLPVSEIAEKEF